MFEIFKAKSGENEGKWMWNLRLSAGGRIIAVSEQTFGKRSAAIADIKKVRTLAPNATIAELL